ncbi:hypothetical protein [Xylanimonas allomyrinae]|uniref:hypothetical protein n=1 Tax=Xylanimonas allomyrinae TaxID=2509459 RepID=UPI0013A6338C|nr:hypothetical protein [Xylanimonas allomyrinae]
MSTPPESEAVARTSCTKEALVLAIAPTAQAPATSAASANAGRAARTVRLVIST